MNRSIKVLRLIFMSFLWTALFFPVSCRNRETQETKRVREKDVSPVGTWRGVLVSPGGELPFQIEIKKGEKNQLTAGVRNGEEYLPFSGIEQTNRVIKMTFDHYDSSINAEIDPTGITMKGTWTRRSMGGKQTRMEFHAEKNIDHRFPPVKKNAPKSRKSKAPHDISDISGEWETVFTDDGGTSTAKAIFSQQGTKVTGTFLTTLGDYRFLEGTYDLGILQLSVFDGAHAFLFRAVADANVDINSDTNDDANVVLRGDFWSRDTYHATWTAVKGSKDMPDPYTLTRLTNDKKRFSFNFPGLDGKSISDKDPRFKDRVLIVYIFGTWCPNCNDEASFLEELYRTYHHRGLEIVGLANEFTGDFEKDSQMVRRYIKKYDLSWPVLIVGIADKKKTAEALSDLDRVLAYPTTLFIDRQKRVQKIYTGFSGPGTGKYHQTLRAEFKQIIDNLLKE